MNGYTTYSYGGKFQYPVASHGVFMVFSDDSYLIRWGEVSLLPERRQT